MADLKTKVSGLKTPTRSGAKCTASWTVPSKAVKSGAKADTRFDGLDMLWVYDAKPVNKGTKKGKGDVLDRDDTGKEKTKSDSDTFGRKKFWPYTDAKLAQIEFWVRGYNVQSSKRHYGPWTHAALKLKVPKDPKTSYSYNSSNGKVSATYESEHPDGAMECCRTKLWLTTGSEKRLDGSVYDKKSKTVSYEVPRAKALGMGQFVKCTFSAQNQGLRGNSGTVKRTLYVVNPNPGVLGTPSIVYSQKGVKETAQVRVPVNDTGRVKVGIDEKKKPIWQYPTKLTLQRRKDVPTDNDPASAAQLDGWEDVMSDNGVTGGLTDTWAQGVSAVGLHTWYRLKSERDGYTVLSMPVCAKVLDELESSTVAGAANIDSATPGADGTSVVVELSGKEADDDGYEVSWSTAGDAWESTEQPSKFETTGSRLVVKKLDNGTRYYFKARAYDTDADGNTVYGKYSGTVEQTPVSTPSTVVLSGDATVARGSSLQLSWTYDTEAQQTAWRLVDRSGMFPWRGEGPLCAHTVTPDMYGDAKELELAVELTTIPGEERRDGWARSEFRTFSIADPPTCYTSVPETLAAQPLTFSVESDVGDTVAVSVASHGATSSGLHGDRDQMDGDTVWSAVLEPDWTETASNRYTVSVGWDQQQGGDSGTIGLEGVYDSVDDAKSAAEEWVAAHEGTAGTWSGMSLPYTGADVDGYECLGTVAVAAEQVSTRRATVELPSGADFRDLASYTVSVSVIDGPTGLSSAAVESDVIVNWAHKAEQPAVAVSADQSDRSAEVTVSAPSNYVEGDRFDLYRVTPDGERRIAEGLPFGTTVTDRMAPFSTTGEGLAYMAATRTSDGHVCASEDAPYSIKCRSLRFDWAGRSVELPYDFGASDSIKKDSEHRGHLDGTSADFWNPAIEREASLSTDVVKFRDTEQQEAVRAMLQYAGSVFVRTPDGIAFEGDVRSGIVERSYDTKVVGMSFEAVEHDLTDSGRPSADDIAEPEWGGGAVNVVDGVVYDSAGGFPMDAWDYIGTASGTEYVYDGEGVRTVSGALVDGWTWDGITLYDSNGDPVEVS